MAEGKDIPIRIKTTADTSGAKAAEDALKKVGQAADSASDVNPMLKGKAEYDAKIAAERELGEAASEAARKQAEALKQLDDAAKKTAQSLPELREADVVAESVERLGKASEDAAGKGGGGLSGLAKELLGGGALLAGYQKLLEFGIEKFVAWRNALSDWGKEADQSNESLNKLATGMAQAAEKQREAEEAGARLAATQAAVSEEVKASATEMGQYTARLADAIAKEREMRELRNTLLDKEVEVALAGAEGDPEKQAQIREEARKKRQEIERKQLEEDIAAQRKIRTEAEQALPGYEEKLNRAEERRGGFTATAEERRREAKKMEDLATLTEATLAASQEAVKRAEEENAKFWTPTAIKNTNREIIAREQERQNELYGKPEQLREKAGALQIEADENTVRAQGEAEKAEQARRLIEERRDAADKAAKEEARLTGTVQPFMERRQSLEDRKAEIEMQNLRKRQQEKELIEKQRVDEQAARDAEARTREEAGIGKSALGLLPKGVTDEFRASVTKAAKNLQDGDQGGEMKELVSLMNRLAAAAEVRGTKTDVDLKSLGERIRRLEGK